MVSLLPIQVNKNNVLKAHTHTFEQLSIKGQTWFSHILCMYGCD